LQMLGAFGRLGITNGKSFFADQIPAALSGLNARLAGFPTQAFPRLRRVVAEALEKVGIVN